MKIFEILFSLSFIILASATPWIPEEKPEGWWHEIHREFVDNTRNNNGSIRVLFYGDSITDWWRVQGRVIFQQYYAPLGTANYGIYADKSEHLLWRIKNGEVTNNLDPDLCVIKIGTNNFETDDDDISIATGIAVNVMELRERLPNMKILLLGILPRNNETLTRRTININGIIKNLDNGNTIRFLDMKDHFYRGGNNFVTELYQIDLLHISELGYQKWAQVMNPLFTEMLNDSNNFKFDSPFIHNNLWP